MSPENYRPGSKILNHSFVNDELKAAEPVLLTLEHLGIEALLADICHPVMRSKVGDLERYACGSGRETRVVVTSGGTPLEEAIWSFPNLRLIACVGAGYDGIDLDRARKMGVRVTTGRGVNDEDVADMALGLLLATVRQIPRGDRLIRSGRWKNVPELQKAASISQMRCGIVGLGAIGSAVGRRLTGFGTHIKWWGPNAKPEAPWPRARSLLELASDSDALIVCAPASAASHKLIDSEILAALGAQGYLINISRGSLVDEEALITFLHSGDLAGAGLDVFSSEPHDGSQWKSIENVVLTPHIGAWAERGIAEASRSCVTNVRAFLADEPLESPLF